MAAALVAQQLVTASVVGNAFVTQYYHILHLSPGHTHRFYQDISMLGRQEEDGTMTITTTMEAINAKILSLNNNMFKAEIKSVDSQESFSGGVHVLVTGCMRAEDNSCYTFVQSFFLAPQDKGYFVLNDTFRYLDSVPANPAVVNDVVVPASTELATIVENHVPVNEDSAPPVGEAVAGEVSAVPATIVEEEISVAEVVDEVEDDAQKIVESSAKIEELPKKSYASIVSRTQGNVASSPPPQVTPRKAPPMSVEPVHPPSAPATVGPVSGSEVVDNGNNPDGEADGYSIYIRGLPMNATESLLEEVFKKFGTIKPDGIQVRSNRHQAFCFGFVEFEDASSVEKALEASPVTIGARKAFVEEKRSTNTRGNPKGRFQPGRGSGGFRNEGVRGRGNYGGGRGYGRGDFNGRGGEFGGRGGRSSNRDGYQRSENMSNNGGSHMNRTGGFPNGNTNSVAVAPRVSATA
ncbi:nuclear transport factor 2-like isoform X2 [Salvia hispanica]|uniref:nuclear transport factor 2-like isoform X2 n=1 Tax=Salvia hispanica TaxID=49212 RepID=UPI002009B726|nr:nuclear transport factor 2-like isoform X2 [Salvia hispanica]